jgi:hypothetical protein
MTPSTSTPSRMVPCSAPPLEGVADGDANGASVGAALRLEETLGVGGSADVVGLGVLDGVDVGELPIDAGAVKLLVADGWAAALVAAAELEPAGDA